MSRETVDRHLTPEEIAEQVASLRTVGGVYHHVADWVEYDNLTAPLTPTQLESLGRYGITADALNLERTTP